MLFDYEIVQTRTKLDLSTAESQVLATTLISAIQDWASNHVLGFPIESAEKIEYFEDGHSRLWLSTDAPISGLTIEKRSSPRDSYEAVSTDHIHNSGDYNVYVSVALPSGFQSVKATYTTGWTSATIPADLKDALIELVGLKLQEVTNFSSNPDDPNGDGAGPLTGAIKRVQAIDYTEEYFAAGNDAQWKAKARQLSRTIGDNVPQHILDTIEQYRGAWAV